MRVLVTGGAGFLGSHLAERLVAGGHHVICLDDFSSGRRENIDHLADSGRFAFLECDVVEPLPDCGPFDRVFHLASPVARHVERPVATVVGQGEGHAAEPPQHVDHYVELGNRQGVLRQVRRDR